MSQLDRHLTTEQLSAMLDDQRPDDQLSLAEQTSSMYYAHMQTCKQCQQELAELRQTVALLRALPQPTLPRSFALPDTFRQEPVTAGQSSATTPARLKPVDLSAQRAQRRASSFRTTLRIVSTLVATIGVLFVLSGLLNTVPFMSSSNAPTSSSTTRSGGLDHNGNLITPATTSTTNKAHNIQPGMQPNRIKPIPVSTETVVPATPTATQGMQPANSKTSQVNPVSFQALPYFLIFDLNDAQGRLGLGLTLFILGSCGIMYFKVQRDRYLNEL